VPPPERVFLGGKNPGEGSQASEGRKGGSSNRPTKEGRPFQSHTRGRRKEEERKRRNSALWKKHPQLLIVVRGEPINI